MLAVGREVPPAAASARSAGMSPARAIEKPTIASRCSERTSLPWSEAHNPARVSLHLRVELAARENKKIQRGGEGAGGPGPAAAAAGRPRLPYRPIPACSAPAAPSVPPARNRAPRPPALNHRRIFAGLQRPASASTPASARIAVDLKRFAGAVFELCSVRDCFCFLPALRPGALIFGVVGTTQPSPAAASA